MESSILPPYSGKITQCVDPTRDVGNGRNFWREKRCLNVRAQDVIGDGVAYDRRGVTSCVRTRAYGESIPPSGNIFPPNDVMRAYACVRREYPPSGKIFPPNDVMRAYACVRAYAYVRREYKGIFMFVE